VSYPDSFTLFFVLQHSSVVLHTTLENFLFENLFNCIVVILFLFDAKLYLFEIIHTQKLSFSYKKSQIVSN